MSYIYLYTFGNPNGSIKEKTVQDDTDLISSDVLTLFSTMGCEKSTIVKNTLKDGSWWLWERVNVDTMSVEEMKEMVNNITRFDMFPTSVKNLLEKRIAKLEHPQLGDFPIGTIVQYGNEKYRICKVPSFLKWDVAGQGEKVLMFAMDRNELVWSFRDSTAYREVKE